MGFQDLNVSKQILMALEEAGFENPTPIQEEVFSVSRSGRDLIGIAQTGKDAGLPDPDVDEIALRARVGSAGAGGCSHAGTGGAGVREC